MGVLEMICTDFEWPLGASWEELSGQFDDLFMLAADRVGAWIATRAAVTTFTLRHCPRGA